MGCETWPDRLEFQRCLRCGELTERCSNVSPLNYDRALALLLRARFNAFYAARCERLHIPVAGPLPEWYEPETDLIDTSP